MLSLLELIFFCVRINICGFLGSSSSRQFDLDYLNGLKSIFVAEQQNEHWALKNFLNISTCSMGGCP